MRAPKASNVEEASKKGYVCLHMSLSIDLACSVKNPGDFRLLGSDFADHASRDRTSSDAHASLHNVDSPIVSHINSCMYTNTIFCLDASASTDASFDAVQASRFKLQVMQFCMRTFLDRVPLAKSPPEISRANYHALKDLPEYRMKLVLSFKCLTPMTHFIEQIYPTLRDEFRDVAWAIYNPSPGDPAKCIQSLEHFQLVFPSAQIIVLTISHLLDLLRHAFLDASRISAFIMWDLTDCLKNHPYVRLVQDFLDPVKAIMLSKLVNSTAFGSSATSDLLQVSSEGILKLPKIIGFVEPFWDASLISPSSTFPLTNQHIEPIIQKYQSYEEVYSCSIVTFNEVLNALIYDVQQLKLKAIPEVSNMQVHFLPQVNSTLLFNSTHNGDLHFMEELMALKDFFGDSHSPESPPYVFDPEYLSLKDKYLDLILRKSRTLNYIFNALGLGMARMYCQLKLRHQRKYNEAKNAILLFEKARGIARSPQLKRFVPFSSKPASERLNLFTEKYLAHLSNSTTEALQLDIVLVNEKSLCRLLSSFIAGGGNFQRCTDILASYDKNSGCRCSLVTFSSGHKVLFFKDYKDVGLFFTNEPYMQQIFGKNNTAVTDESSLDQKVNDFKDHENSNICTCVHVATNHKQFEIYEKPHNDVTADKPKGQRVTIVMPYFVLPFWMQFSFLPVAASLALSVWWFEVPLNFIDRAFSLDALKTPLKMYAFMDAHDTSSAQQFCRFNNVHRLVKTECNSPSQINSTEYQLDWPRRHICFPSVGKSENHSQEDLFPAISLGENCTSITLTSAGELLSKFCSYLPKNTLNRIESYVEDWDVTISIVGPWTRDKNIGALRTAPMYSYHVSCTSDQTQLFQCKLLLPNNLPPMFRNLSNTEICHPYAVARSKVAARNQAEYLAVKKLWEYGLLDSHGLPSDKIRAYRISVQEHLTASRTVKFCRVEGAKHWSFYPLLKTICTATLSYDTLYRIPRVLLSKFRIPAAGEDLASTKVLVSLDGRMFPFSFILPGLLSTVLGRDMPEFDLYLAESPLKLSFQFAAYSLTTDLQTLLQPFQLLLGKSLLSRNEFVVDSKEVDAMEELKRMQMTTHKAYSDDAHLNSLPYPAYYIMPMTSSGKVDRDLLVKSRQFLSGEKKTYLSLLQTKSHSSNIIYNPACDVLYKVVSLVEGMSQPLLAVKNLSSSRNFLKPMSVNSKAPYCDQENLSYIPRRSPEARLENASTDKSPLAVMKLFNSFLGLFIDNHAVFPKDGFSDCVINVDQIMSDFDANVTSRDAAFVKDELPLGMTDSTELVVPDMVYVWPINNELFEALLLVPSIFHCVTRCLLADEFLQSLKHNSITPNSPPIELPDIGLLLNALQAPSIEYPARSNYERLEILGDSLLKLNVSLDLFLTRPKDDEGLLTSIRSTIVANQNLNRIATNEEVQLKEFADFAGFIPQTFPIPICELPFRLSDINNDHSPPLFPEVSFSSLLYWQKLHSFHESVVNKREVYPLDAKHGQSIPMTAANELIDSSQKGEDEGTHRQYHVVYPRKALADMMEAIVATFFLLSNDTSKPLEPNTWEKKSSIPPSFQIKNVHSLLVRWGLISPALTNFFECPSPRPNLWPSFVDTQVSALEPGKFQVDMSKIACMIEKSIGYKFSNLLLLRLSLTHSSLQLPVNYERLEYLGDAVLDWYVTHHLYTNYADLSPHIISESRAASVNNETLGRLFVLLCLHALPQDLTTDVKIQSICNVIQCSDCFKRTKILPYLEWLLEQPDFLEDLVDVFSPNVSANDLSIHTSTPTPHKSHIDSKKLSHQSLKRIFIAAPKILGDCFESLVGAMFLDSYAFKHPSLCLDDIWRLYLYPIMALYLERHANPYDSAKNPVKSIYDLAVGLGVKRDDIQFVINELEAIQVPQTKAIHQVEMKGKMTDNGNEKMKAYLGDFVIGGVSVGSAVASTVVKAKHLAARNSFSILSTERGRDLLALIKTKLPYLSI